MIGHNVAPGVELVDYLREKGYEDKVDVGAICCTAHDLTRYYSGAKIIGSYSRQLHYIRSGLADVVMVDEQCVNLRTYEESKAVGAPYITTNEKIMGGFPNRTNDPMMEIVDDLVRFINRCKKYYRDKDFPAWVNKLEKGDAFEGELPLTEARGIVIPDGIM